MSNPVRIHANTKKLLHSLPSPPHRKAVIHTFRDEPDGSHYERDEQERIERLNAEARRVAAETGSKA